MKGGLHKKVITDKNGHRKVVWVKDDIVNRKSKGGGKSVKSKETNLGKVGKFDLIYQTDSKINGGNGIAGTIRTNPQNYYVASISGDGKLSFKDLEVNTKNIDKNSVKNLWSKKGNSVKKPSKDDGGYKLGAKYSNDFDYKGMLSMGAKAKITDSVEKLNKLHDSYTDVNYHSEGRLLTSAIDALKEGNKVDAKKWMDKFNTASKES